MKRSLFSLLLVLALLVTASVFAVEATPFEEAIDNGDGTIRFYCEACKSDQDWTPVALRAQGDKLATSTGHLYVPESYTLDGTPFKTTAFTNVGGKLCLYLAGDMQYTGVGRMFQLYSTAGTATYCEVNLMGTGTIKCASNLGKYGLVYGSTNDTGGHNKFAVYGGTIDCSGASATSGVVFCNNPKSTKLDIFEMHGGTIIGGTTTGNGGAIYNKYGEVTIEGGTIVGGEAAKGGAMYLEAVDLTMTNGTITGGTSTDVGGNLVLFKGSFDISGGLIEHGTGKNGGNIYLYGSDADTLKGELTLGSNATVAAGSATSAGGNIMMYQYGTLNLNGGTVTTADVDPGDGDGDAAGTVGDCAPNIGVTHTDADRETSNITFVNLNSGSIVGGDGYEGGAVWFNQSRFGDTNRAKLTLGNVTIHNEDSLSDIYNALRALVTVDDSFTGKVVISTGYDAATTKDGDIPILKRSLITHSGYETAGEVIFRYNEEDHELIGWVNGANKNMSYGDALLTDGSAVTGVGYTQDLVDNYDGTGYIKLFQPSTIALSQATKIDFNGQNTTVTGAANLIGMDAATNDYVGDDAAKVTLDAAPALENEVTVPTGVRKYLGLENTDGTYSFHRYYLSMNDVGLRANAANPALLYSGVFYGDEAVAAAVNAGGWGIKFYYGGDEVHDASFTTTFTAGVENKGQTAAISGYMGNQTYAEAAIGGEVYITVNGQTIACSDRAEKTMKHVVEHIFGVYNYNPTALDEPQKNAVLALYEAYKDQFTAWDWNAKIENA